MGFREEIDGFLKPILEADFEVRRRKAAEAVQAHTRDLASRGLFNSGARIVVTTKELVEHFEAYMKHAFDELIRTHRVLGARSDPDLVAAFERIMEATGAKARTLFEEFGLMELVQVDSSITRQALATDLSHAALQSLKRIKAEIALYAAGIARGAKPEASGGSVQMNFHGPVGAVMTGAQSVANVTQTITVSQRAAVLSALDAAESVIKSAPEMATKRDQLLEVTQECREVANKPAPNPSKLRAFLTGLTGFLEGLAAAKPALDEIENVLDSLP